MNRIDKMQIMEMLSYTNLYLTADSLVEIWKDPKENPKQKEGKSGLDILEKNPDLIGELLQDDLKLYYFLIEHEDEIDKPRFLMTLLLNYKKKLSVSSSAKMSKEEIQNIQYGIKGIKKLLQGIDKTFVFYNLSDENRIASLTIINSKEEVEGIDRKKKNSNAKRLKEFEEITHLGNVVQSITLSDIENIISYDKQAGNGLKHAIEYNAIMNEVTDVSDEEAFRENILILISETIDILTKHIEEINFDKLLLCSAYRYMEELEEGNIKEEAAGLLKERLELFKEQIRKNVRIEFSPNEIYSIKDLERDLKRFIGEEKVTYISKKEEEQIISSLLTGENLLQNISPEKIEAISIPATIIGELLKNNPENYIFFLKQEKSAYNKKKILQDIINVGTCSEELLKILCEKTDITSEEICNLFEREIISVSDLKNVREQTGTIITNSKLFEQYKKYRQQYKNSQDADDEKIKLERYALAYRNTEILGKSENEIQQKSEDFMTDVGDEIEPKDIMQLYGFNIIPLETAVDWGGEKIIEQLLESESLKPADARYLRNQGYLDENVIKKIFKNCRQMSYAYQVSLVYTIFDGQTPEEQQIREELAQYYNIENGIVGSTGNGTKTNRTKIRKGQHDEKFIKMRDPGAKYNLLAAIDKDTKIEEGIIDGHIIFHYPNVEDGIVLIEKLHKIKQNRENGLIEIKPDNQAATYVLSEEEFIKIKSQLIKDGKVDRTELTQRWWKERDAAHWIPHTGISAWERALKERFMINNENPKYTQQDLQKIEQLIEKSIDSKREER